MIIFAFQIYYDGGTVDSGLTRVNQGGDRLNCKTAVIT